MSEVAATFVLRHTLIGINQAKKVVMQALAAVADDRGRAKMTQPMIVTYTEMSINTVQRATSGLRKMGRIRRGGGGSYVIVGVAEHDLMVCPHVECSAEAVSIWKGDVSAKKRAQAAFRARKAREKRKAAQLL